MDKPHPQIETSCQSRQKCDKNMKRGAAGSLQSHGSKKSKGGFPTTKSLEELEECFGEIELKGSFPTTFEALFTKGTPHAAPTFNIFTSDLQIKIALLQLLSRSRRQVSYLANPGLRAKPLYIFFYNLLAACRHGALIISAEGLDDEQHSEDSEDSGKEDEEGEGGTDSAGRSNRLCLARASCM